MTQSTSEKRRIPIPFRAEAGSEGNRILVNVFLPFTFRNRGVLTTMLFQKPFPVSLICCTRRPSKTIFEFDLSSAETTQIIGTGFIGFTDLTSGMRTGSLFWKVFFGGECFLEGRNLVRSIFQLLLKSYKSIPIKPFSYNHSHNIPLINSYKTSYRLTHHPWLALKIPSLPIDTPSLIGTENPIYTARFWVRDDHTRRFAYFDRCRWGLRGAWYDSIHDMIPCIREFSIWGVILI